MQNSPRRNQNKNRLVYHHGGISHQHDDDDIMSSSPLRMPFSQFVLQALLFIGVGVLVGYGVFFVQWQTHCSTLLTLNQQRQEDHQHSNSHDNYKSIIYHHYENSRVRSNETAAHSRDKSSWFPSSSLLGVPLQLLQNNTSSHAARSDCHHPFMSGGGQPDAVDMPTRIQLLEQNNEPLRHELETSLPSFLLVQHQQEARATSGMAKDAAVVQHFESQQQQLDSETTTELLLRAQVQQLQQELKTSKQQQRQQHQQHALQVQAAGSTAAHEGEEEKSQRRELKQAQESLLSLEMSHHQQQQQHEQHQFKRLKEQHQETLDRMKQFEQENLALRESILIGKDQHLFLQQQLESSILAKQTAAQQVESLVQELLDFSTRHDLHRETTRQENLSLERDLQEVREALLLLAESRKKWNEQVQQLQEAREALLLLAESKKSCMQQVKQLQNELESFAWRVQQTERTAIRQKEALKQELQKTQESLSKREQQHLETMQTIDYSKKQINDLQKEHEASERQVKQMEKVAARQERLLKRELQKAQKSLSQMRDSHRIQHQKQHEENSKYIQTLLGQVKQLRKELEFGQDKSLSAAQRELLLKQELQQSQESLWKLNQLWQIKQEENDKAVETLKLQVKQLQKALESSTGRAERLTETTATRQVQSLKQGLNLAQENWLLFQVSFQRKQEAKADSSKKGSSLITEKQRRTVAHQSLEKEQLQLVAKAENDAVSACRQTFGPGPYIVEFELHDDDDENDDRRPSSATSSSTSRTFQVEFRDLTEMPYSIWNFLDRVHRGLFDGTTIGYQCSSDDAEYAVIAGGSTISAQRNSINNTAADGEGQLLQRPHLEVSRRAPCLQFTLGFYGDRGQEADYFFISLSSKKQKRGAFCPGRIIHGRDAVLQLQQRKRHGVIRQARIIL